MNTDQTVLVAEEAVKDAAVNLDAINEPKPTGHLREQSRSTLVNEIVSLRMLCSLIAIAFEANEELKGLELFINVTENGKKTKIDLLAAIKGTLEGVVPE